MEKMEKKRLPLALAPGEGEEPNETVVPLAEAHPEPELELFPHRTPAPNMKPQVTLSFDSLRRNMGCSRSQKKSKFMSVYGCRVSGDPQKDGLRQLWREADTELGKEQDRTLGVSCVRNAD